MTATLETTVTTAAEELLRLAEAYVNEELPAWEIHQAVDRLADPTLAPAKVWAAFQDLTDALDLQDDLDGGRIDWTSVDDELTDPAAAHDVLAERIQDALTILTGSAR